MGMHEPQTVGRKMFFIDLNAVPVRQGQRKWEKKKKIHILLVIDKNKKVWQE